MPNKEYPKPDEKVCYNCKYMLWMVGIGFGVRCGYDHYTKGQKYVGHPEPIPHRRHTCEKFSKREGIKE